MTDRMTEAEFNALLVRRVGRNGTSERLCTVAHAEIIALRAEVKRLEALLRPFAEAANGFDSYNIKNPEDWFCYGGVHGSGGTTGAITVGDLRRARAALEGRT